MRWKKSIASVVVLGLTASLSAQEAALKLIPHDAGAALVVRNLKDLRTKGDRAAAKIGRRDLDFSKLMTEVLKAAELDGVVDETSPSAIIAVSTKSIGQAPLKQIVDFRVLQLLVLAVPFKDRDAIGAKVGLKPGELKVEELQNITSNVFLFRSCYVRGNYLYMGLNDKAVKYAATAKPLSEVLPDNQMKILGQSDVLLQLGTFVWGKAWEDILNNARRVFGNKMDAAEKDMGEKIVKSMEGIRFGLFGLRLEEERAALTLVSAWDKDNKAVAEVLGLLRYSDSPTDLRGLPAGNLIFAETAKGNGVANAMLARVLFKAALQDLLQTEQITTAAERLLVVGVFNEIWYNLLGNRTGLYQIPEDKKQGKIAIVSILDTADGAKFYDHFAELAKIGDGALKPPALDLQQLIGELGAKEEGRQRELALLKLRLLGPPALPALEKAAKSENELLAKQASKLNEEIERLARERKQVQVDWVLRFRPTLEVLPQTEKRKGLTVHFMKLKLPPTVGDLSQTLETMLGPEWNKVRFAAYKKNAIIFLGSSTDLFDETLANVQGDKMGLAGSKYLQGFGQKVGPDRRVEFHLAMSPLMALFAGEALPAPNPKAELSSISLSVRQDSLQLDMWLPYDEVRPFNKLFPF
jgi:hypothetical protein